MTTSVAADVLLLLVAVGVLAMFSLAMHVGTRATALLSRHRPELPVADRPPVGLGRLVPVGTQVEQETRRGLLALELWLAARRR